MSEKKKIYMLNFMKIFAILLIFNSHCDKLYPKAFLATGGALGNALFFIISGYLLKIDENFISLITKKIKKLYIPVFIVSILSLFLNRVMPNNIIDFVKIFIWPTNYWFIGALIIFYILIFILNKKNISKHFGIFSFAMLVLYFVYYIFFMNRSIWSIEDNGLTSISGLFKLIYYFYIFALGFYIKQKEIKYENNYSTFIEIVLVLVVYFIIKLLLQKSIISMQFQFIVQYIGIAFSYLCLKAAISFEDNIIPKLNKKIIDVITYFSGLSLEIYLIQFFTIKSCESIVFPINIIVASIITIIISIVLNGVVVFITKALDKKLFVH